MGTDSMAEGGGVQAPEGFVFELSGGRLCLDFANTVDHRLTDQPVERLGSYADLIAWAQQAGVVARDEAEELREVAAGRGGEAEAASAGARTLREALFALFSAVAKGQTPPEGALAALNRALPNAMSALRIADVGEAFEWRWSSGGRGLDRVLSPVIRDAAELLTSADLSRVRVCESETCGWLFLDKSRNRSRRWCDMSVCGNRAKARRHYERKKRGSDTAG